ncbi:leucine-rich repeat-containing protein 69 [Gracilinanus agilis]|uniref:leucine-rich repeat-containing protein 69 n=1 Tax=Gracilinanus agilis TaxID=191870 RepID=UPI001CFD09A2|nr:leucine-rich repeat-containing protein 69 [Gracilinanus agilis]
MESVTAEELPEEEEEEEQEQLLKRHRKEKKELQAKIQSMKNAVPKNDKKRRKQLIEDVAKLEGEMERKHREELEHLKLTSHAKNKNLKYLSLNHNRLIGIPKELCSLPFLSEIQLNYNQIVSIPEEFRNMKNLSRLSLARNCIKEFPIVLCVLKKLRVLDLAGNFIQTLPKELRDMKLRVFFCEENPFVKRHPIYVEQKEEILTLKEITARYILNEMSEHDPLFLQGIEYFPEILNILSRKRTCLLCGKRVLFTDIKCVTFKRQTKVN